MYTDQTITGIGPKVCIFMGDVAVQASCDDASGSKVRTHGSRDPYSRLNVAVGPQRNNSRRRCPHLAQIRPKTPS